MNRCMRLGVLLSGGGTTFWNLHEKIRDGKLAAEIACVISSRSRAPGLEKAQKAGYPHTVVGRKKYPSDEAYSEAITALLKAHDVDLVVLAGFLRRYLPGPAYAERCINIHPALLPSFGGQGFYGDRVHQAVWRASCKVSGCTVHLVNEEYDAGPIIVQKAVAISDRDSPEDIRAKVFRLECEALPEAITYYCENRIRFEDGRAIIR